MRISEQDDGINSFTDYSFKIRLNGGTGNALALHISVRPCKLNYEAIVPQQSSGVRQTRINKLHILSSLLVCS